MALAFGLLVGYWVSIYSVGHFSVETCLWSMAFSLVTVHSIGVFCAVSEALLRPRLKGLPRTKRLWFEVPTSVAAHILGFVIPVFLFYWLFGFPMKSFLASFGIFLVVFLVLHEFEYLVRFYRELKQAEITEERLKALAAQSELKALKAQINPHFLFNTLNTIAQLIHADPAQAEATVERLAEMFRYVLAGSERGLVPLEEELSFVDDYLAIEQARFGERLRVTREIASEALNVTVPSLVLQPLVENAVRHGQGTGGSVDLTIRVRPQGDEVMIVIADRGLGMRDGVWEVGGGGHGLRNVDERLRKIYGEAYGLEIRDNEPQGTVVTVRIPTSERSAQMVHGLRR
jgi:two-component system LytT family sensor kinase